METIGLVCSLLAAAVGVVLTVLSFVEHLRRQRGLRSFARRMGFRYGWRIKGEPTWLSCSLLTARGPARLHDVLSGKWEGYDVHVFDYGLFRPFRPRSGISRVTCFLLEHEKAIPEVLVERRPTSWDIDVGANAHEVKLESLDFLRAFRVFGRSRRAAYDICHPRLMEYLLANSELGIAIGKGCLILWVGSSALPSVEGISKRLTQLVEIRKLIPEFVFQTPYEGT